MFTSKARAPASSNLEASVRDRKSPLDFTGRRLDKFIRRNYWSIQVQATLHHVTMPNPKMITNDLHSLEWLFCRTLSYHLSMNYNRCSFLRGRFLGMPIVLHETSWIVMNCPHLVPATRHLSWSADDNLQRSDARAAKGRDMRRDAWKITICGRHVLNCCGFFGRFAAGWGLSVFVNILLPTTDVEVVTSSDSKPKRHEFELAAFLAHACFWGRSFLGLHHLTWVAFCSVESRADVEAQVLLRQKDLDLWCSVIDMIDMIELGVELRTQLCKTEQGMSHCFLLHISWSRMIPHF